MSDESIYALIPPEQQAAARAPRHKSKFASTASAPPTASTFGFAGTSLVLGNVAGVAAPHTSHPAKKPTGTFGRTVGDSVVPTCFLKKSAKPGGVLAASAGSGAAPAAAPAAAPRHADEPKKAPVPLRTEKPVMGLKTDKNFVVANAVETLLAVPRKTATAAAPRPVERDDYGRVPTYIEGIKSELSANRAAVAGAHAAAAAAAERFAPLGAEELAELRAGLQKRWDALNRQLQTMGFSVETASQKRQQELIEAELQLVEAAQLKLSRAAIFVYDDKK